MVFNLEDKQQHVLIVDNLDVNSDKRTVTSLFFFHQIVLTLHQFWNLLQVDPSLIGGMQVSIGDRYIDMSMANKIKNYTNLLKQAV